MAKLWVAGAVVAGRGGCCASPGDRDLMAQGTAILMAQLAPACAEAVLWEHSTSP